MSSTPFLNSKTAHALLNQFSSPLYVYDETIIRQRCKELKQAFSGWKKTQLYYACKANSNLHILKIIKEEGYNLDCVSVYETELGLLVGFKPHQKHFSTYGQSNLYPIDNTFIRGRTSFFRF